MEKNILNQQEVQTKCILIISIEFLIIEFPVILISKFNCKYLIRTFL